MKLDLSKYPLYITIEFILSILTSLILMSITYIWDGEDGILKLFNSVDDQYKPTNLINIGILLFIGIFLWIFNYFFNHSAKFIFNKISNGLFDIGINILRLGGGILISYPFLHLCVAGYTSQLISFWLVGFCAICEAAFFYLVKDSIEQKRNRPLKK
ncbi:hypothetical protein G9F32_00685 [Acinetobacter sp. 194]|uniref:hypothetical protein n=1 Tax=Acinetobacter shaoyimingii TaxID=2715164 RepID=UPI00140D4E73|nr:hypothetical protein [Acinetobacter shaoyimingii]NHB56553.1 hypothetical protein [Acinetobacter shaoyimingii]